MSKNNKKLVKSVVRFVDGQLKDPRNREALEGGRRELLGRLEGLREEVARDSDESRKGEEVVRKQRRTVEPMKKQSFVSQLKGAVAVAIGGSSILALALLALFASVITPTTGLGASGWLVPGTISGVALWAMVPSLWLLVKGVMGFRKTSYTRAAVETTVEEGERQLLEALERRGEISPARAAMETSLTVSESDRILGELAGQGYLTARVHEGALVYALWDRDPLEASNEQPESDEVGQQAEEGSDGLDRGA